MWRREDVRIQGRPRVPFPTGILLVVGISMFLILVRVFRGTRRPGGIGGWLTTRSARTMVLATSVLGRRPAAVPRPSAKDREMTRNDGLRRVGKRAGQVAFPDIPAGSAIGSERAFNPRVAGSNPARPTERNRCSVVQSETSRV